MKLFLFFAALFALLPAGDDRGYIVKVVEKAPDITITYTDGTTKKLSDFRG